MAHRSFFSYGVTRSYPLKWLTPVVVVGFIITTALVSFLNVAATGYELVSQSSQNPNATEANNGWLSKWPSYLVGARASCSSVEIQVQSIFYTDKRAFPYTLSRVWHLEGDGTKIYQGSLIYKSSRIQNCNITDIKVQFEATDRSAGQLQISPMGGTVTITTECYIEEGSSNRQYFEILNTYDALPKPNTAQSMFLTLNKTESPSIYWGYSILGMYWRTVMQTFYDENMLRAPPPFFKAVVGLERNTALTGTVEEQVSNVEFLKVGSCFFIPLNSTGVAFTKNRYCNTTSITELAESPDHPATFERPMPAIWRAMAVLGKGAWFTTMADLGQDSDSTPNMLARPELLENLTSDMTRANQTLRKRFRYGVDCCGDLLIYQHGFDQTQSPGVGLRVDQSVIAADYLCQVPQLKSPGNLIISVLVADLVLLQAIWKIFVLIVDKFCIKTTEEARYCANCAPAIEVAKAPGDYKSIAGQEPEVISIGDEGSFRT
ncbi:hypothetical protein F4774DRAFT_405640 [Daldinia eschscholtzii]|nr:hypothetical protein F4774DRAFT_405640 [Daldinia eschscholtzii]